MVFHKHFNRKFSLWAMKRTTGIPFTTIFVAALLGIHLTLLGLGTFCASATINPNPEHHQGHESSTSILCAWACHVGQIATSTTPIENLSSFFALILFWMLSPFAFPFLFRPFSFASPRGPPLV